MDKKTMYFMENESKGFLEPKLSTQNLEPHQVGSLFGSSVHQWCVGGNFQADGGGVSPDWLPEPNGKAGETVSKLEDLHVEEVQLQSPKSAIKNIGIFEVFPSLSFEDAMSRDDENGT